MKNTITLHFKKKPSDLLTLWQAFQSRKSRFNPDTIIPEIHIKRDKLKIDHFHLKSFYSICEIDNTSNLHILYPFTLVYPYLMRLLCRHEMPFSQFKTLNTRNIITLYRTITPDEIFNIDCYNSTVTITPKGLECEFKTGLYTGKEKVWENSATYFFPGKFGEADSSYSRFRHEKPDNPIISAEWYLDARNRFKFGRVSGDTNGIHYSTLYARLFGFKRDFAQPIRIIAKCVSKLPDQSGDKPANLDFLLKGPVYYNNILILKNQQHDNASRFDLYCKGNERPCISGRLVLK